MVAAFSRRHDRGGGICCYHSVYSTIADHDTSMYVSTASTDGLPQSRQIKERKKEKKIRPDHPRNPPPSAPVAAVLPSYRVYSEGFGAVPSANRCRRVWRSDSARHPMVHFSSPHMNHFPPASPAARQLAMKSGPDLKLVALLA